MLNQHNGKRYIGLTAGNFAKRRNIHLSCLKSNRHINAHLQSAWNQGDRYLLWTILEVCSTIEELKDAEVKWIAYYNTTDKTRGYNLTNGGDGLNMLPETRAKISATKTGTTLSEEHKQNISAGKKGKKRKPFTPEHRAKISATLKNRLTENNHEETT